MKTTTTLKSSAKDQQNCRSITELMQTYIRDDDSKSQRKMSRPDALDDACDYYYNTQLSSSEIKFGRETVSRKWTDTGITGQRTSDLRHGLSERDLTDLFNIYDATFFAGAFRKFFTQKGDTFRVIPSERLRSVAGKCAYDPQKSSYACTYWIELAVKVFAQTFSSGQNVQQYRINGLFCHNRLECLQMTLEHEMIHLLMYLWIKCNIGSKTKSGIGGHGPSFKRLAFNIFGHTETKHSLFEGLSDDQPEAPKDDRPTKAQLRVGQKVQIKGEEFVIIKLNPTRFRAQNILKGTQFDVPYLYPGYTLL